MDSTRRETKYKPWIQAWDHIIPQIHVRVKNATISGVIDEITDQVNVQVLEQVGRRVEEFVRKISNPLDTTTSRTV